MGKKRQRIDIGGGDPLAADSPFAALSPDGLPSGPAPREPRPVAVKKRETLLLRRLKAGRGGKVVTEISGFQAAPAQIQELLKRLQSRLGTGGTAKGKLIELQGECRGRVKPLLEDEGYGVKGI